MNSVYIKGRFTRDVEVKYLPSGDAVAEIGGAWGRKYKDKEGNQKEKTVFFSAKQYGKSAEWLSKTGKKGAEFVLEAELDEDRWETKENEKRSRLFLNVSRIDVVETVYGEEKAGKATPTVGKTAVKKSDDSGIPF